MKKKMIFFSLALLGIIVAGMLLPRNVNAQDDNATIQFDPMTIGLMPASKGTVSIVTDNVRDLYALEFHLTFNPQLMEVVDADQAQEGIQIASTDVWKDGFVALNKVDNNTGKIDFAVTLLNPAPALAGKQTVATITFNAKNEGTSQISIDSAILSTRDAQEIAVARLNGLIGVSPSGVTPDTQATLSPNQDNLNNRNGMSKATLAGLAVLVLLAAVGIFGYAMKRRN